MDDYNPLSLIWQAGNKPYSQRFGDHFYSREDGRAECCHVFLHANKLPQRWPSHNRFNIAELGFGTGLNFLETWRQWCRHRTPDQHLHFTSFEAYPLASEDIERALGTWPQLALQTKKLLQKWPQLTSNPRAWEMDSQTTLTIIKADAFDGLRGWSDCAHAWYLDGFSPERNPDMWSQKLLNEVYTHTWPAGTFATYTAAGWVRRTLQSAGFTVEKLPGHANKRHMLAGYR